MAKVHTRQRKGPNGATVAFVATLVLYLLTTSYTAAEDDGLKETSLMLQPGWQARSYHLLHTALNRFAYYLVLATGWEPEPCVPIHLLNCLLGAVAAALVWRLLREYGCRRRIATACTAIWVLSWTPWYHSRTAETAMTPMPFLLGSFLLLMTLQRFPANERYGRLILSAVLISFSILLSLNFVLLVPAWLVQVGQASNDQQERGGLLTVGVAALLVFCGVPFLVAASYLGHVLPSSFLRWLTYHEDTKGLSGGGSPLLAPFRALVGLGRLAFPPSAGETALKAVLTNQQVAVVWQDWLTLVRNLLASLLLLLTALRGWWSVRQRPEGRFLTVAVGVTAALSLIWLGSDSQYWLPVYPFLLVLAGLRAQEMLAHPQARDVWMLGAGIVIGTMVVSNLPSNTPTPLSPGWSQEWLRVFHTTKVLDRGDLLLVPGNHPLRRVGLERGDVMVVDLIYTADESLEGHAYLDWVGGEIDDALRFGKSVYIVALRDPLPAEQVGAWEMVAGRHGVKRQELADYLDQRYRLGLAPAIDRDAERVQPAFGTASPDDRS